MLDLASVKNVQIRMNRSNSTAFNSLLKYTFYLFIYFKIDLYWSIIGSQYCVSFCCTTK